MLAYQHVSLSRDAFEAEWRSHFDRLFRCKPEGGDVYWLPDQVFKTKGKILLYHPQPYYLRCDYHDLEKGLIQIGEEEFVVVDKNGLEGKESSDQVGILFRLQQRKAELEETGRYHIEGQPSEFYVFGKRNDWGFASSEPYNIGVLNVHEAVLKTFFFKAWPGVSPVRIKEYLKHTPASYRSQFERNYLGHKNE